MTEPLNEYIGRLYGRPLPPARVNGVWESRYEPFGPDRFATWEELDEYQRANPPVYPVPTHGNKEPTP